MNIFRRGVLWALWGAGLCVFAFTVWLFAYSFIEMDVAKAPLQFTLQQGSSLRSAARQMHAAGALSSPSQFELLARLRGDAARIQAGSYELDGSISPHALLRKITSGDQAQEKMVFVEGWTFRQMRAGLDAHNAIRHDTRGLSDAEVLARLGIALPSAEGLFYPDTYYFAGGTSDIAVLQRAYRAMQEQLATLWSARTSGLPLATPYQALILASIVEKETGQAAERPLVAAVFINRLRQGMRLQTDPAVIYGLGDAFDGNLRRPHLQTDGPYNTYLREGLPPTPIAMPGLDALRATLNPAPNDALYFVARGDGTSHFSRTLAEHERAVTKYQRRGIR